MKLKFKRLYLAHPLLSRHRVRMWELKIEKKFGIQLENPFYDKNGVGGRDDTIARDSFKKVKKNNDYEKRLVHNDLKLLGGCEGVLAIIDGVPSYGTIMEIVYAKIMKKPVFIICTNDYEEHPWLLVHSDMVFDSFEEFEEFLKE